MHYQTPSGKAVEMTLEKFLSLSDEDLQQLDHSGFGNHIEDPWFGSALHNDTISEEDFLLEEDIELTEIDLSEDLVDLKLKFEKTIGSSDEE